MKKNIIFVGASAIVIIVFCVLWILLSIKGTSKEDEKENSIFLTDVEIFIFDNSISASGMRLKISNKSNRFFYLADDVFLIQEYKKNRWIDLVDEKSEKTSKCDEIELRPDGDYDYYLKWEWLYGKLKKGKYKILFPIDDGTDTYWITKDFVVLKEKE